MGLVYLWSAPLKSWGQELDTARAQPMALLVYLWSAPLKSWGQELDTARAQPMALLEGADASVAHRRGGISAHQNADLTEKMVSQRSAKNLHISDGFGELEAMDRSD